MQMHEQRRNNINYSTSTESWLYSNISDFGKWQFYISLLMSLLKIPLAWIQMSIVFLAPPTQFWCSPPDSYANYTVHDWIEISKPQQYSFRHDGLNNGYCVTRDIINGTNNTLSCSNGYSYNRTTFQSSIITEWNLICGQERLVDISQIILMAGILTGNIFFGVFADVHGRKKTLSICIIIQLVFGLISAWIPWFWGFVAARFLSAVANGGIIVASFVMCMEIVGGKWRTIVPILYQIPFGFGYSIMSGFAYFLRDWRQFQYALTGFSALFIIYIWIIPESPRWLLVKGQQREALRIIQSAAKFNGIKVNELEMELTKLSNIPVDKKKITLADLFRCKTLKHRTIFLCVIWLLSGTCFFTFSQYLGQIGQNLFVITALGGLISIPGIFVCLYLIGRYGRRWTIASFALLTMVCFLVILAFPKGVYDYDWPRMAFAGLGLIGMSISIPALYLFTGELFPTVVRNSGMGFTTMFMRIGSMIAPLIIASHDLAVFLPLLILGICSLVQAISVLLLPETKGKPLPELMRDLETNNNNEL